MTEQTDMPALFGRKGEWIGLDSATLEALPDDRQRSYINLRDEVQRLEPIEADLKSAQDRVTATANEIREVEAMKPKPLSQHDLWKQHFGRKRHA